MFERILPTVSTRSLSNWVGFALPAAMALGAPAITTAGQVCDGDCRISFEFQTDGILETGAGAQLEFGVGASFDLGAGGEVIGSSEPELVEGAALEGQLVELAAGAEIRFGAGGYLDLGQGGNVHYTEGTVVIVRGPNQVEVQAPAATTVRSGAIESLGSVSLAAGSDLLFSTDSAPTGLVLDAPDPGAFITIAAGTIEIGTTLSVATLDLSAPGIGDSATTVGNWETVGGITLGGGGSGIVDASPVSGEVPVIEVIEPVAGAPPTLIVDGPDTGAAPTVGEFTSVTDADPASLPQAAPESPGTGVQPESPTTGAATSSAEVREAGNGGLGAGAGPVLAVLFSAVALRRRRGVNRCQAVSSHAQYGGSADPWMEHRDDVGSLHEARRGSQC